MDENDEQADWRADVDRAVLATLAAVQAAMIPVGAAGVDLTKAIARAAEGGKRTRSTLLVASHHAHGGTDTHAVISLGAGLELFHTAALLHDDVLDASDTRRGRPSTHRTFEAQHRSRGWQGDAAAFGHAGAILAGDIALMASGRALFTATSRLPQEVRDRVTVRFHDTAELVTAGQYLDMRIAAQAVDALTEQETDIRATMHAKTASYTGIAPLTLGAAAAGVSEGALDKLTVVGTLMGMAFQLRDDILGLTGSPEVTGKPTGDDIREGKRTLLIWHAWANGTNPQRAVIRRALGDRKATDADVAAAVAVVRSVGSFDVIEHEIQRNTETARTRLARLGLLEPYASMLDAAAAAVAERVS